jgi:hypothetical protein
MELDDLKHAWEMRDRRLDEAIRLNNRVLQTAVGTQAKAATKRLSRLLWIELLANLVAVIWLGSFLGGHLTVARYAIPAVALDVLAIGLLIAGARQLVAVSQIDYSQPVLVIQKRIESLRAERIRATMLTLVVAPLAWIPLLIVALKGFFDVDAYATFGAAWLIANVLFGLIVLAAAIWASRHYAGRVTRSSALRWLMDNLAGRSLRTATTYLRSLADYEGAAG